MIYMCQWAIRTYSDIALEESGGRSSIVQLKVDAGLQAFLALYLIWIAHAQEGYEYLVCMLKERPWAVEFLVL